MSDRPTIVVLGFRQTFEKNKDTGKMDRPVDWVTYAPIHAVQSCQIEDRVDNMRPPEAIANDDEGKKLAFLRYRWDMIEKAYSAWKQGIEIPLDGTPLGVWPGINEGQANAFRSVGIRTVEGIAAMPDNVVGKVPLPGVREIKRQAALFLENSDRATAAAKQDEQQQQIKELQEKLDAAMDLLEQQTKPRKTKEAA